jgi:hypothetical protein
MDKISLMEYPEVVYWCDKHRVYHVGRNIYIKPEVRSVYEPAAWARGRETRLRLRDEGVNVHDSPGFVRGIMVQGYGVTTEYGVQA